MADIFLKLLNMSFTASFLIVAVLILRVVLKKAPRRAICFLWGLLAIRLICPFSIESVWSMIPSARPIPAEIEYMESPQIESGLDFIDNTVNPIITENLAPNIGDSVNPLQIWLVVAGDVWGIGMVVMLLYAGISYVLLYRKVRVSISGEEGTYICDAIDSPFILGIVKPRIYLPSDMEAAAGKYVIAHEKAHLRRLDHLWKPFGYLLLSVYWFNPLLWAAYAMLCRDIELACDERVVKDMDVQDKKAYSHALLSCSSSRKMIAACPLAFGEVGVKERVKTVLNYRKPSFWIILILAVAVIGIGIFFMTDPVSEQDVEQAPIEEEDISGNDLSQSENTDELLVERYIDISQLKTREAVGTAGIVCEDRLLTCQNDFFDELEHLIYNYYYFQAFGKFDKLNDLIGQDESFQIAAQNTRENFEEGIYMSEYQIHQLSTLTAEEVQKASESTREYLCQYIAEYNLTEYAIVKADISWKHNAASLSLAPQLGDGRYTRYYLLGATEDVNEFKIYNVFWESFYPEGEEEAGPDIQQVMDRILSAVPLEEAIPLTTTADLPSGDQLYFLDKTEDGKYSLYGFHSDEYGYTGMLINYEIDGEDNWNYIYDIDNWIGYEFPRIAEAEDGGLFLTYCYMGGTGAHMDRLFYFKAYETGKLQRYELNHEELLKQAKSLVSFKLDADNEEVQVFDKEGGTKELFALIPYTYAMNGQDPVIKGVYCISEQIKFISDPAMAIVGVGIYVEDSILPVHIGELAFRIAVETDGDEVQLVLYDVSTYENGVIYEGQKPWITSRNQAVTVVREQLIKAYENVYGPYLPSDVEPGLYSDDASRLAYIIPRLTVSEETEEYYVIPVIWDFRINKYTGEVTVYYNGIEPMEFTFDPTDPKHLAFAG